VELYVLIAGGGTGGHLYPGIAVARALLARVPDAHLTFVGTATGIESRVVPREGFTLDVIRSAGLKGKSLSSLARGLALLPASALDAWQVITRRRPSVVIGVGGYSSGPVVALAAVRGIPTLLMEQNAVPGLTNRLLSSLVSAAAVTYEESLALFGNKAFVAGNPVRPEFLTTDTEGRRGGVPADMGQRAYDEQREPPRAAQVLVFGGSQGAHAINVAMVEAAPRLAAAAPAVAITHQSGERDLEMVRDGYRRAGLEARVEPFLFAMDREMKAADLVVCRSGATTLAELTAAARPSILIPFPGATDDHQRRNAEALAKVGAAKMVDQRELTGERLATEILALSANEVERHRMGQAAARLARPDAAKVIVDKILELAR
jgi:UDP-N-acetylglucosamine--N-acetylmuramyl-(pentapeptide) pyrophosphoryl-undecaprenol N-acetylglucosamine transferase